MHLLYIVSINIILLFFIFRQQMLKCINCRLIITWSLNFIIVSMCLHNLYSEGIKDMSSSFNNINEPKHSCQCHK